MGSNDFRVNREDLAIELFRPGVIILARRCLCLVEQLLERRVLCASVGGDEKNQQNGCGVTRKVLPKGHEARDGSSAWHVAHSCAGREHGLTPWFSKVPGKSPAGETRSDFPHSDDCSGGCEP